MRGSISGRADTKTVIAKCRWDMISRSRGAMRPGFTGILSPREGVGNAGRRCTRSLACESKQSTRAIVTTGPAGITPAFPHATVLTVSFALSPVTGRFCHRHRPSCLRRLDASVGASGPHDFAVRRPALSSAAPPASTASRPTRKGRFAIITDAGCGMRWTQGALLTRALACGRRSRVVLTPRRRRQARGGNSAGDGDKKARSPGRSRRKPLKPLRAGMPG